MSVNVSIPEELYKRAAEIAAAEHVSVDEIFASAFAEQWASWERLRARAARGDRDRFLEVLGRVPDVESDENDRL